MGWAEEGHRVGRRGVAQQAAVGQAAEPELVVAEDGGRRADPVLGHALAGRLGSAQRSDGGAAEVEPWDPVGGQDDRPHGGPSLPPTADLARPGSRALRLSPRWPAQRTSSRSFARCPSSRRWAPTTGGASPTSRSPAASPPDRSSSARATRATRATSSAPATPGRYARTPTGA